MRRKIPNDICFLATSLNLDEKYVFFFFTTGILVASTLQQTFYTKAIFLTSTQMGINKVFMTFKRVFKLGLGVGLGLGLGLGIVLGLGLGTGLALGLRVGWVLCITARSYSN